MVSKCQREVTWRGMLCICNSIAIAFPHLLEILPASAAGTAYTNLSSGLTNESINYCNHILQRLLHGAGLVL